MPDALVSRNRHKGRQALVLLLIGCVAGGASLALAESSTLDQLLEQAHAKHLADQRYWRLLLHEHTDLFGFYRSDIDDKGFFLSAQGRTDPSAELDATLKAFFEPVSVDTETQHPQCRYPARYAWLKEQLGFDGRLPEQSCPRFQTWRSRMDAESVTLVFASYYLNNPSSMYGHTFLRLNRKSPETEDPLLDYTVNYAADVHTHNGIAFALRGLTGGYRGRFSTLPYYVKVQQYSNLESRDLWEYTLTLDGASVDRLLRHVWELGQTSMAYYFLNKNCSYQLLPLLEVADPRLHLSEGFWFKTVPVDTLRVVLKQPGLVSHVYRRPSHVSKMLAARSRLVPEERRLAKEWAVRPSAPPDKMLSSDPPERQALILDSAYDLFRYRFGFYRDQPPDVQQQEQRLLLLRSQLRVPSPPLSVATATEGELAVSPDQGHPTGRIGLGYGFSNRSHFEELSLRPALHDHEDPSEGYIPGSQLKMFDLRLRYDDDRKTAYVQNFTLLDLESLSPWDPWVHPPSWKVNTGLAVANDLNRDPENSLYYGLNLGTGLTFEAHLWREEMFYALIEEDTGAGHAFDDGYRFGGGGSSGILFHAASFWTLHFQATYLRYPVGNVGSAVKLGLIQAFSLSPQNQLRVNLERQNAYQEVLFTLQHYL